MTPEQDIIHEIWEVFAEPSARVKPVLALFDRGGFGNHQLALAE